MTTDTTRTRLVIVIPKGEARAIKVAAAQAGISMSEFVRAIMAERIKANGNQ